MFSSYMVIEPPIVFQQESTVRARACTAPEDSWIHQMFADAKEDLEKAAKQLAGVENMPEIERELFEEFKRVDAICRDMFSCQYGVSEYISQMEQNAPQMRYGISSWDEDYRKLKRIRWLRNQIAHETSTPGCTDDDVAWLKNFHNRILTQQDPLAALEKKRRQAGQSMPQRSGIKRKDNLASFPYRNQVQSNRAIPTAYSGKKRIRKLKRAFWGLVVGILIAGILFYFFR